MSTLPKIDSGSAEPFTSSVSNLVSENFNDCVSSLKVIGEPWVAYEHTNFQGSQYVYEEGEYATVERNDTFSSLEKVTEDLANPQITLYEHTNYRGRSLVFTTETNLCYGNFNHVASSHKGREGYGSCMSTSTEVELSCWPEFLETCLSTAGSMTECLTFAL
uniref:Beta/gamma crystallin 'Greek key' domain-containing protein n=1 Tax=Astyanax mexicanus TaxID=7994 RepID=A0A3B1INV5_ASTMX